MHRIVFSVILILASAGVFFYGVYGFFAQRHRKKLSRRLLRMTALVVVALLLLKFGFAIRGWVPVTSSFLVEIMQAFSLDASYESAFQGMREISSPVLWWLLSIYMFLLCTAAPLVGGFFLYDVLAGVSPEMYLRIVCRRRIFYVFSELNEKSIMLAEDIRSQPRATGEKIVIVFTDTYVDSESEEESELLARAKSINAVCLEIDILHCDFFHRAKMCYFLLMDARPEDDFNDGSNFSCLYGMFHPEITERGAARTVWNPGKGCKILIFSNDNDSIESIRSLKQQFDAAHKDNRVSVNVIRDFAQTSGFHLQDHPLFAPARGTDDEPKPEEAPLPTDGNGPRPLRVVIFGNNTFSREMFKTIFTVGQMLETQLFITVVYQRSPDYAGDPGKAEFAEYLDRLSPEIIASCTMPTMENKSECLRIRRRRAGVPFDPADYSAPYAGLSFIETDLAHTDMHELLSRSCDGQFGGFGVDNHAPLYDCDYFLIMHGTDRENVYMADALYRTLLYYQIQSPRRSRPAQGISVVVKGEEMTSIVRARFAKTPATLDGLNICKPVVLPFASLRERFTWKNVYMDPAFLAANRTFPNQAAKNEPFADSTGNSDIYSDWSVISRIYHREYKVRSAELYTARHTSEGLIKALGWLEHRRWTSFIRTQGFTAPFADGEELIRRVETDEHLAPIFAKKDVALHLHPCLVESALERMVHNGIFEDPAHPTVDSVLEDRDDFDLLDWVSLARIRTDGRATDLKKHDIAYIEGMKLTMQVIKKPDRTVSAFRLGENDAEETRLIREGRLSLLDDGTYRVFSREARQDGQKAIRGDYVKLDNDGEPYPVRKEDFEKAHESDGTGVYRQIPSLLTAWEAGLPRCEEITYLLDKGLLVMDDANPEVYYSAPAEGGGWDTALTAPRSAVIIFDSVERGADGAITDVAFHFIVREEFRRDYLLLPFVQER